MLQRRDSAKIIRDLLETTGSEVSQNQIMRRANLKTSQAKLYIAFAKERGWLKESNNEGARRYRRTIDGWHFLQLLTQVTVRLDRPAPNILPEKLVRVEQADKRLVF